MYGEEEGKMKKLTIWKSKGLRVFASFVLTISVLSMETACFWLWYQPKVPEELVERKLLKQKL